MQAAAFFSWLVATAAVIDFVVFRLPLHGWAIAGAQMGGYMLMLAPLALWARSTFATLAMPMPQVLAGVALMVAAMGYEALVRHLGVVAVAENTLSDLATGFGEELAFRGFLWGRTRAAGLPVGWLVAVNVLVFTAWHLISVASGLSKLSGLATVAVLGLVFSLVRLWSGNTGLPGLLHAAVDIAGV